MKIELQKLGLQDGIEIYEMLQKLPKDENGFLNSAFGLTFNEYLEWLKRQEEISNGIGLEEWMVNQSVYWLFVDDEPVGCGKIRHRLTDLLRETGGNLGYAIIPEERGKGYGTILLSELIKEAKRIGVTEFLVTVNSNNIASQKVAEKCGGKLTKKTKERYYYNYNI